MAIWKKLKESRTYRVFDFLAKSAQLMFILTFVLFFIDQYYSSKSEKETLAELDKVAQAISTRFIGVFPSYLSEINNLIRNSSPKDTVVIFEDVLYYGCLSQPDEFKALNKSILERTDSAHVVIAYYDVDEHGNAFKRMIAEKLLGETSPKVFRPDRSAFRDSLFQAKRDANFKAFSKTVDKYLKPFADIKQEETALPKKDRDLQEMYRRMDKIKTEKLGKKNKKEITFEEYKSMYREITHEMIKVFQEYNIELIPLKDYLTMSCWMVGDASVIAFPSRYSTDEIGFVSHEKAFITYIHTMLESVRKEK